MSADEAGQLCHHWIVAVIFEDRDHPVLAGVRSLIGDRHDVLGIEFTRLDPDAADR